MDFYISSGDTGGSSSGGSSSGGGGGSVLSGGGRIYDESGNGIYYDKNGWHYPAASTTVSIDPIRAQRDADAIANGIPTNTQFIDNTRAWTANYYAAGGNPYEAGDVYTAYRNGNYDLANQLMSAINTKYGLTSLGSDLTGFAVSGSGLLPPMPASPPQPSGSIAPPVADTPSLTIPAIPPINPLTAPVNRLESDWRFDPSALVKGAVESIGSLFMKRIPNVPAYNPVTAPTFAGLNTKRSPEQSLNGESQTLFPWQRSATVKPVDATTEYLRNYQQEFAPKAGLLSSKNNFERKNEWGALPSLDSYSLAQNKANVPDLAINNQQPPKVKPANYIDDYIQSNRDNLTKGIWQAYA